MIRALSLSLLPYQNCSSRESVHHLLWSCSFVSLLWDWATYVGVRVSGPTFSISPPLIFFAEGLNPSCTNDRFIWFLVSVLKYQVWKSRCQAMYDGSHVDPASVLRTSKVFLKQRIQDDFNRLDRQQFFKRWSVSAKVFSVHNNQVFLHL